MSSFVFYYFLLLLMISCFSGVSWSLFSMLLMFPLISYTVMNFLIIALCSDRFCGSVILLLSVNRDFVGRKIKDFLE